MTAAAAVGFPSTRTALLTAHFGDPAWVELLLRRARAVFPELGDESIYVIDQDRTATSADELRARLGPVQILRFPVSEPHVAMTGHDHAHVLSLAVRAIDCDYLMIFDSDAHPVLPEARQRLGELIGRSDAVLAASDAEGLRTHPCFMLFGPAIDRERLFFDEGQLEVGVDTGREVGKQVDALGRSIEFLRPSPAFEGRWGQLYLGGSIYHHGSGSFGSSTDTRLRRQFKSWRREEAFFRRRVFAGRYELSEREDVELRALSAADRQRRKLGTFVRLRILRRDPDPYDRDAR